MNGTDRPAVLAVEDDPQLADLYAMRLSDDYDVRVANDGETALESVDDDVDVVLLDRRMPGLSGDEVLSRIRERDLATRVAMVTAVDPDFDVVDMGFDDYLVKPVTAEELDAVVERLLLWATHDEQLQRLFGLASKKALLESRRTEAELRASEEYARLQDRLAVLRARLEDTVDELAAEDAYDRLLREVPETLDGP